MLQATPHTTPGRPTGWVARSGYHEGSHSQTERQRASMIELETSSKRPQIALGIVGTLVAVKLLLHLATNAFSPYEFHRDAFLYMAMGEHLRLWRMDFPPFIALVAELSRGILGDSLFAVRMFPTVAIRRQEMICWRRTQERSRIQCSPGASWYRCTLDGASTGLDHQTIGA